MVFSAAATWAPSGTDGFFGPSFGAGFGSVLVIGLGSGFWSALGPSLAVGAGSVGGLFRRSVEGSRPCTRAAGSSFEVDREAEVNWGYSTAPTPTAARRNRPSSAATRTPFFLPRRAGIG